MSILYVAEHGAVIGIEENYVYVKLSGEIVRQIPIETLEAISLFGKSQLTTQSMEQFLIRGIPVTFYSGVGKYFGRLHSTSHTNTERQRKQATFYTKESALQLAKTIIRNKVHNQLVVLQRYSRNSSIDIEKEKRFITIQTKEIDGAKDIEQLMGHEGIIARYYFEAMGKVVDEEFAFEGRSRRPPRDPVNALLSLGYSILMYEFYGKLENKSLNPYFGFIHADRENHPTLCSDLMEEWRAVIVDSVVLGVINGHELKMDHFVKNDDGAVYLTKEGLSIFIQKMENKLNTKSRYFDTVENLVSFRRAMELQIESLIKVIEADDATLYLPLVIR